MVLIFLLRRRELKEQSPKDTDDEKANLPKGQGPIPVSEIEVPGACQREVCPEEREYGGRLQHPNDIVEDGGRLAVEL